jgi:hypothetical protein
VYVGQIGKNFTVRFNEHKHAFWTNSHTSKFALHLTEHNHSFGTIHNTMQILKHHRKGPHLNTLERFHIYAEYITNNHINDNHTIFPNKIFDVLLNASTSQNPIYTDIIQQPYYLTRRILFILTKWSIFTERSMHIPAP